MEFLWTDWNVEHIGRHGVGPEEAEAVVVEAKSPYPRSRPDRKWLVWGPTAEGKLLQVVFVRAHGDAVFVIHARPLTDAEKRRHRRSGR